MGTEHLSTVFDHAPQGGSHLTVLLTVAHYCDHRGEWTVDQATLQRRARLGRRRVQQLLGDLTAAGQLAVTPGDGRGKHSTYRLLVRPKTAQPQAQKGAEPCTLSAEKSAAPCTLSVPKGEAPCTLSAPPRPPFPPHPQSPLTPKSKKQETFGLPPAAAQGRLFELEEKASSPLPGKGRAGAGRGARGEGAVRPLSASQSAVARVNRLLEDAGVPRPSPSQIGLWSKTLGGIEPLLDFLRRLIANGLAAKRDPIVYIHSSVTQSAGRPQAARFSSKPRNVCLYAGADEQRIAQAARIAAFRGHW